MTKATKELNEIIRNASLEPALERRARQQLVVATHRELLRRPMPVTRLLVSRDH
jgi:hypothetical protein